MLYCARVFATIWTAILRHIVPETAAKEANGYEDRGKTGGIKHRQCTRSPHRTSGSRRAFLDRGSIAKASSAMAPKLDLRNVAPSAPAWRIERIVEMICHATLPTRTGCLTLNVPGFAIPSRTAAAPRTSMPERTIWRSTMSGQFTATSRGSQSIRCDGLGIHVRALRLRWAV
jgi:hypothetical protein